MRKFTIEELREAFTYEPETGAFYRKGTLQPVERHLEGKGYITISSGNCVALAHRAAWALHYGEWPTKVDHIDRNRRNNKIDNLRIALPHQNNANRNDYGKVRAKGVCRTSNGRQYRAQIKLNGIGKHLGTFYTIDEAAHAYNKAAIEYHGEFALLNPIGQDK